jgi:flagella basal body P-ring formation protein FlgA
MIRTFAVTLPVAAALVCAQIAAARAQIATTAATPVATPIATSTRTLPTLKRAVTVSGDIVRIGDLIENAGAVADAAIFRSPDVGTTGSVSVQQVLDAVQPYHIYLVNTAGLSAVEVTRAGRTIDFADLETRIANAFAGRYGLGEAKNLAVTLDIAPRPTTVEASVTSDLVLASAALNPLSGRFEISFEVPGSTILRKPLRFTGSVVETVEVAVTTRALPAGTIVKDSDLSVERRPKQKVAPETLGTAREAIGLAVRSGLRAGQPLRRTDLMKPQVVHRDDSVTLVYEVPGIMLTIRGKALESGAEGDVINVLNVQSKRTVQGTVTGPNRVDILVSTAALPRPTNVANAPSSPPTSSQSPSVASR